MSIEGYMKESEGVREAVSLASFKTRVLALFYPVFIYYLTKAFFWLLFSPIILIPSKVLNLFYCILEPFGVSENRSQIPCIQDRSYMYLMHT